MDAKEPQEKQKAKQKSLLASEQPKVARFKKYLVAIGTAVAAAIVAAALLAVIAPKQKAEGKEDAGQKHEQEQLSPRVPDPIRDLGMQKGRAVAGNMAATGQNLTETGNDRVSGAREGGTSEEDASGKAREQALKDAVSAISSPVTFGQNDLPQQGRNQEAHQELMIPPLPGPMIMAAGREPDDQNLQGEKREFAKERPSELPYLKATLRSPLSPYEIKAGTILPALLITGINSDLPGQLVAQLRENVYDTVTGNHLLIPQGTRLIGEYDSKIAFGQERVLVVWTRLIMPNGDSVNLEGMPGTDLSGYAGVSGKVNNHYGKLVTGVVLGSVIGAGAQVAVGGQGAPNVPPSFGQMAVSGAAQNINQSAQQHTGKVLNMQPTIEVTPGDKINVFVTKDIILKPFKE